MAVPKISTEWTAFYSPKAQSVEVLRYKSEGSGFDSRLKSLGHFIYSISCYLCCSVVICVVLCIICV